MVCADGGGPGPQDAAWGSSGVLASTRRGRRRPIAGCLPGRTAAVRPRLRCGSMECGRSWRLRTARSAIRRAGWRHRMASGVRGERAEVLDPCCYRPRSTENVQRLPARADREMCGDHTDPSRDTARTQRLLDPASSLSAIRMSAIRIHKAGVAKQPGPRPVLVWSAGRYRHQRCSLSRRSARAWISEAGTSRASAILRMLASETLRSPRSTSP